LTCDTETGQAAVVAADYKYTLYSLEEGDKGWYELLNEVHMRTAKRMLKVCLANRGTYVKAAQQIASLNHVLPREFTDTLSVLQDKVIVFLTP
jgi:aarF domain-containing kinase